MAERIEDLISQKALDSFDQLNTKVATAATGIEKLIAKGVELNNALSGATGLKDFNKTTKELTDNENRLTKAYEELQKKQQELNDLTTKLTQKTAELKRQQQELAAGTTSLNDANRKQALTTEQAITKLVELTNKLKENKEAQKDVARNKELFAGLNQSLPQVQKGIKDLAQSEKELVLEEKQLRISISETNKEIKEGIQLNDASIGSINQAKAAIKSLTAERNNLDLTTKEGVARQQAINKEIDRYNLFITANVDKQTKQSRNVGNYVGAVKTLERALQDVRKKLDDFNNSADKNTDVIEQLKKEEELLNRILGSQVTGFATNTQAINESRRALQELQAAGLEGTEAYNELFKATAALRDETNTLKKSLANAAPDDLAFNAAADAARGLIGVYGLAQSVTAAFGVDNEELQATLVKLQAAETALHSIEAIRTVLKKESALRQAISIGLTKVEVVQTNLQTAAESRNIVVRYAAIIAQKALNAVMALGSGPILAIIGVLTLLVISLSSFSSATNKAKRDFEKLNEEFKGFEAAVNEEIETIKRAGDENVAALESQFASEKKIREARRKSLQEESAAIRRFLADNGAAYQEAFAEFENLTNRQRAGEDLSKAEEKRLEQVGTFVQQFRAARERDFAIDSQIAIKQLNDKKANTEEEIKARQEGIEAFKIQLQTSANLQRSVASDDQKTFDQRIEALRSFNRLQEQIINADATKQRLTPGQTPTQIALIERTRSAAIIESRRNSAKEIEDLTRQFAERERAAQFEIARQSIQTNADKNLRIVEDETKSFTERFDANKKYFDQRESLVKGQLAFDLANNKLLQSEREALEKKANDQILFLRLDFLKKSNDLSNQLLETEIQGTLNRSSRRRDALLRDLAQERADGLVGEEEYQTRRLDIEFRYAQNELKILIATTKKKLEIRQKSGEDVTGLLAQLAAYERQLEEDGLKHTQEIEEKKFQARLERIQKLGQITGNVFSVINELQSIQFDTEKTRIEEAIAEIEKKSAAELAAINASALSEEDKANRIQILNATTQAQKEQQERRLKQVEADRARFERVTTIQRIIADTAAAVVAALGAKPFTPFNIALAASVGVLGAAQLARVIATPLPRFEHGTQDAPGGLALVGEKRKELVVTPGGGLFETPAVPTIMNIPRHSIVLPDSRAMLESGLAVNRFGRLIAQQQDGSDKLGKKIDQLTNVIRNKPVMNLSADQGGLTAVWRYGAQWVGYVEDNVKF